MFPGLGFQASVLVVFGPSFFGLHEGTAGFGRASRGGLFLSVFHDGTDAFGGFLTHVLSKMTKMQKWVIIRQIRSCFVGVPCKMAPGLRDFMVMVFGVSWDVV